MGHYDDAHDFHDERLRIQTNTRIKKNLLGIRNALNDMSALYNPNRDWGWEENLNPEYNALMNKVKSKLYDLGDL